MGDNSVAIGRTLGASIAKKGFSTSKSKFLLSLQRRSNHPMIEKGMEGKWMVWQ